MAKLNGKQFGKEASAATKGYPTDPNTLQAQKIRLDMPASRVSAGDPARNDVKTTGIETRGNGCATKGRMARGPMA
jgi:hypothetical protein